MIANKLLLMHQLKCENNHLKSFENEHINILPDRFQMEGQEHAIALSRRQFGRRKALIEPTLK